MGLAGEALLIEPAQKIELTALLSGAPVRVGNVFHRGTGSLLLLQEGRVEPRQLTATETRPLANAREKSAAVIPRSPVTGWRIERDEARQVFVLAAKPVDRPRAERGSDELETPRVHLHESRRVIRHIGVKGIENAEIIRVFADAREQAGHAESRLPVAREGMDRTE